ncbi:MAG: helix-turn-helix domain-containing protein [Pseudomonadota bacterium]
MTIEGRGYGLSRLYQRRIAIEAVTVAAEALCVSTEEIMSRRRAKANVAFARQIAIYLAHVVGQLSLGQVSTEFNRERTTVGYSCHAVEDRRDSPIFDKQVEFLEAQLRDRLTTLLTQEIKMSAKEKKSPARKRAIGFREAG